MDKQCLNNSISRDSVHESNNIEYLLELYNRFTKDAIVLRCSSKKVYF